METPKITLPYGERAWLPINVSCSGKRVGVLKARDRTGTLLEVVAPDGWHFAHNGSWSLLCTDAADMRDRLAGEELEPCEFNSYGNECACGSTRPAPSGGA